MENASESMRTMRFCIVLVVNSHRMHRTEDGHSARQVEEKTDSFQDEENIS
jgi:hypothetical protein